MGELDGRVALITGAARGMGRSHAVRLAQAGANIIAVDICRQIEAVAAKLATPEDLDETVRLVEAEGRQVVAQMADVRDRAALRAAVAAGASEFGRLDVVVANAGTFAVRLDQPMDDAGRAEIWDVTLDINLTGVWNTIEVATPFLIQGGRGGSIVVISSTAALQTVANDDVGFTAYTVSKWGVTGLMKMSAGDLGKHGIRVNAVHPSGVNTPLTQSDAVREYWDHHPALAAHTAKVYLPVEERDVSEAVLYLASDASKAVSGISLPVDAGSSVRWG
ncbi:MAG TPA: mycofactocin-coupled SDR family oxidoreductase [Ilumatobacter sp.]|jgi:SDR family mycofactocin-dependent oxidoreductase|nr:mycofactocin-coupled SDR family oxidoreductase [Ilumatobacter sp.]